MSAEKRFILAMVLSFALCIGWSMFLTYKHQKQLQNQPKEFQLNNPENNKPNNNKPEDPNNKKPEDPNNKKPEDPNNKKPENNQPENNPQNNEKKPEQQIVPPKNVEGEITIVDTPKYQMVWNTKGAGLQSLKLKEFIRNKADESLKDWRKQESNWYEVLPKFSDTASSLLVFSSQDDQDTLVSENWEKIKDTTADKENRQLIYKKEVNGIEYQKVFSFDDGYNVYGKLIVKNKSSQDQTTSLSIAGSAGILWECLEVEISRFLTSNIKFKNGDSTGWESYYYDSINQTDFKYSFEAAPSDWVWVSLGNKYFASILEMDQPKFISSITSKTFTPDKEWIDKTISEREERKEEQAIKELDKILKEDRLKLAMLVMNTKPVLIAKDQTIEIPFHFHVGTRAGLGASDPKFYGLEDYGFFALVSKLLLAMLAFFYGIFGNYGIAIICLTLLVKAVLFPITKKQQVSMQKYQKAMKVLQPQIVKLQKKYEKDRQKMNQEVMNLYKKSGVNPIPVGGCLPILLQIPIFIGLYNALLYSVSIRQQSFLWISDLAQPDNLTLLPIDSLRWLLTTDYFNLLPVIMTIVWIVQQKMMPKPEDPQMQQQQKIFMFMTIFFGYLFYNVASGLVMYWMVMNLFSIFEQMFIKKSLPTD